MDRYYIEQNGGKVIAVSFEEWLDLFRRNDRTVAKTEIGKVLISTVFLGIDHGFGRGRPVLYETMVFGGEHDGFQARYCTRESALRGHEETEKMVVESESV